MTVTDRLSEFLAVSAFAEIPWRKTAIVATVSVNESAATFLMPRADVLPFKCISNRQILIMEEGNPSLGTMFKSAWQNDAEIMDELERRDLLAANGRQMVQSAMATDSLDNPNNAIAGLFEWLIDRRKAFAIGAFSLGPTQMYLRQSRLATPEPGFAIPSFPKTWEALWKFYAAPNSEEQWNSGFWDYLPTSATGYPTPSTPVCGSAGGNCIETYLQSHQTGTRDWADPVWASYANRFKNNVNLVWSTGQAMGYPGIG